MQRDLLTIVSYLVSGLIILEIVVIFYLHRLLRRGKDSKVIRDEHYLELNLKFQYLKTLIVLGGVIIVFLGWNVKSEVADEVKFDIKTIADKQIENINRKTNSLNKSITQLENRRNKIQKEIKILISKNESLKEKHKKLNAELTKRISDIETLLRIYIVTDIPFKLKMEPDTLYYRDLKPINAARLPDFKKPPVINIQRTSDIAVWVSERTTDFVVVNYGPASTAEKGTLTFWIVDRD